MAEKRETNLITCEQQLEMTGLSKSIIRPQMLTPINLETPEDQLEIRSLSPREEGFNPHLATGAYSLLYFSTAAALSRNLDCLPSGKPVY